MARPLSHRDDGLTESSYDYLKNVRLLIIDPSPFMRRTIVGILRFFGCIDYREAADGAQALELMLTWQPDIILTEYAMDPLDVVDLTRILRSERSDLRYVPIVMVTAWSEAWRVSQARDAGVSEFVVKPFSAKGLMLRILETVLHPRTFVIAPHYAGPDRRRRLRDGDHVPHRRESDGVLVQRPPVAKGHVSQEEADRLMAGEDLVTPRRSLQRAAE